MLLADDGVTYRLIAEQLEIEANVVTTWVIRWQQTGSGQDLSVEKRLADAPRSGAPDTFTPEQLCRMVALACELPSVSGRPITHWTPRELRDEVLKQGIVDTISERHTGRVLATRELRPHKRQYWLTGKPDEEKDEKIQVIRQLYEEAPRQAEEGVLTMSIDEKTGIQALERESPHTPMKPGLDEKIAYNYDRHGTQALLAGLNVATGKVLGECRDSRTEEDFVAFITSIRETYPDQKQ